MSKKRKNKKLRKDRIFFNNKTSSGENARAIKIEKKEKLSKENDKKTKTFFCKNT